MASTGTSPALPAQLPFTPGQGDLPVVSVLYSTDDASDTDPLWIDATAYVRSFSVSRGRESERAEIDAGTATIVLDNRTGVFSSPVVPTILPGIRPLNRWWIREQFTGETRSIFLGYAEAYDQTWSGGVDAVATVSCVDEFKVLALDRLPTMSPPRDTYNDLIRFDEPANFWDFGTNNPLVGDPGPNWVVPAGGGFGLLGTGAVIGDPDGGVFFDVSGDLIETTNEAFDTQSSNEMTCEFWFKMDAVPGSNQPWFEGRANAANTHRNFGFYLMTTGTIQFYAKNTAATVYSATSAVLSTGTWYHVAGVVSGSATTIYVNGVQSGTAGSFTGTLLTDADDVSATLTPLIKSAAGVSVDMDELAFYSARALSADRLLEHYQAGRERGFQQQLSGPRITAILDSADNTAPRAYYDAGGLNPNAGLREISPTFMHGQSPLEECRRTVYGENYDAMFFIAADGTITFLAGDHRTYSGYSTVQATFDDDGTDLPYQDLDMDYSEAFLFNDITATREGGVTQHVSDTTSIARFFKRSLSLTDLPIVTDGEADPIAFALLNKYSAPMTRVLSLTVDTSTTAVTEAVMRLELGKRIRVLRTPPGGGTRIDQSVWIQKIDVDANPRQALADQAWRLTALA